MSFSVTLYDDFVYVAYTTEFPSNPDHLSPCIVQVTTLYIYIYIMKGISFLILILNPSKARVHLYVYTHTHTHTHIYMYMNPSLRRIQY